MSAVLDLVTEAVKALDAPLAVHVSTSGSVSVVAINASDEAEVADGLDVIAEVLAENGLTGDRGRLAILCIEERS